MATQQNPDILSLVELVLPSHVVETCHTLETGVHTEFLATNTQKKTLSRIKLFKYTDRSVKITLMVCALKLGCATQDITNSVTSDVEKVINSDDKYHAPDLSSDSSHEGHSAILLRYSENQVSSGSVFVSPEQSALKSPTVESLPPAQECDAMYGAMVSAAQPPNTADVSAQSSQELQSESGLETTTRCGDNVTELMAQPIVIFQHPHYEQIVEASWDDDMSVGLHTNVTTEYVEVVTEGENYATVDPSVDEPSGYVEIPPKESIVCGNDGEDGAIPAVGTTEANRAGGFVDYNDQMVTEVEASKLSTKHVGHETVQISEESVRGGHNLPNPTMTSSNISDENSIRTRAGRKRKLPGKFADSIVNLFGETKVGVHDAVDLIRDAKEQEQRVVLREPLRQSRIKGVQLEAVKKHQDVDPVSASITEHNELGTEGGMSYIAVEESHPEQELDGEICDFTKKKRNYKREQNVACPLCGILLKDYDSVFDHLRLQHAGHADYESSLAQVKALMRVLCALCDRYYGSKDQLLAHHKLMHTDHESARCEECGIIVKSKKHLIAHRKRRHTVSDVSYLCDRCPASFAYQSYLNTHIQQVHPPPGQPDFPCDQCDKRYSSSKYLYCHRLRVHGAKRYTCKYCMKSFSTNTNMLRHVTLIHDKHKNKPFSCAVCNKSFSLKANLQEHVQTVHYRYYNFHCDICKAGFRRKKQLESHKETSHSSMANAVIKCVPVTNKLLMQQLNNPLPSSSDTKLSQPSLVTSLTPSALPSNMTIVGDPIDSTADTVAYIVASQGMLESFGITVSKPNELVNHDS